MQKHWPSFTELKHFYRSRFGRMTHRILGHALLHRVRGESKKILGIGYCLPYLSGWKERGHSVFSLLPAQSGGSAWPTDAPSRACIAYESLLPFSDQSMDAVLLAHVLEFTPQCESMLREITRVLKPNGKLLILAPNALGTWARINTTPFACGNAFMPFLMQPMLSEHSLKIRSIHTALYFPPLPWRWILKTYRVWEIIGTLLPGIIGGVLIIEAAKREYAFIHDTRRRLSIAKRATLRPLGITPLTPNVPESSVANPKR